MCLPQVKARFDIHMSEWINQQLIKSWLRLKNLPCEGVPKIKMADAVMNKLARSVEENKVNTKMVCLV